MEKGKNEEGLSNIANIHEGTFSRRRIRLKKLLKSNIADIPKGTFSGPTKLILPDFPGFDLCSVTPHHRPSAYLYHELS